jgi:hypothetical protein
MANEKHKHLQRMPPELNKAVEEKVKKDLIPSKTFVINKLLQGWVKGKIELNF